MSQQVTCPACGREYTSGFHHVCGENVNRLLQGTGYLPKTTRLLLRSGPPPPIEAEINALLAEGWRVQSIQVSSVTYLADDDSDHLRDMRDVIHEPAVAVVLEKA